MTKKEFWLRLFNTNDIALAAAIHLIERYVDGKQIDAGAEFLLQKRRELKLPMNSKIVEVVFGEDSADKIN